MGSQNIKCSRNSTGELVVNFSRKRLRNVGIDDKTTKLLGGEGGGGWTGGRTDRIVKWKDGKEERALILYRNRKKDDFSKTDETRVTISSCFHGRPLD